METFKSGSSRYRYNALDQLTGLEPVGQATLQRFYRLEHLATEIEGLSSQSVLQQGNQLLALQSREGDNFKSQLLATDQKRCVLRVTDSAGPVQQVYTAYGHRWVESGLGSLLGFNGEAVDPVTRHYLLGNGHRAFNPVLMRFNSPDRLSPFGRGGLNPYAYCQGDPVNFTDPTGREAWQPWLVVAMNLLGLVSGGVGLVSARLSIVGLKTTSIAASASLAKRATYLGAAGAVAGVIGAGAGVTRSIMSATDPDTSAQDPLLFAITAISVLSFAASGASVAYKYRAHKLNRIGAVDVAYSGPKLGKYKNPLAADDNIVPSAPPPTPGSPQASAPFPTPGPIGFETFNFPVRPNRAVDFLKEQLDRQVRIVKSAKSIRRHSK
ncbi:RHS repeat-associated core domain-containing protein [Pseudomonas fluorescens]|uniref:RHS repeat-associated core domain-containing protein n=1 Tax=Pseudomonas fluorescens TaxID=294 RepID=UPI0012406DD7|nr:RHS repeat-associated core domain-containing protein [Pseudomonas fluorescens]VVN15797.1 hypothetical protein PS639_04029 [Pseudomonas fluorescens]